MENKPTHQKISRRSFLKLSFSSLIAASLAACGADEILTPTPEISPSPTSPPVETEYPTDTPQPTETPTSVPTPSEIWRRYLITYGIDLSGLTGYHQVWAPVPVECNVQKDITNLSFSPEPTVVYQDAWGNKIAYWEAFVNEEDPIIKQEFEISLLEKTLDIDPDSIGAYDTTDPNYSDFLISESKIQSSNQEIKDAANEAVGSETNPLIKAELIYEFMKDFRCGDPPGHVVTDALGTLRAGGATCGGTAFLYAALCRAAGVPSRTVNGISRIGTGYYDRLQEIAHTHVWDEFYLPEYGWIPVDVPNYQCDRKPGFGVFDGSRLICSKGTKIDMRFGANGLGWFHQPFVDKRQSWRGVLKVTEL